MRTPHPWILPTQPATRALLVASGASVAMIETRLRCGDLIRLRQGVYLAAAAWPDDPAAQHLMLARAELVMNPLAVMSHASAAIAWGLPSPGFGAWHLAPVSVTVPAGSGRRSRRTRADHHVMRLPAAQVTRDAEGYPLTTVARTAVDLAEGLELPGQLVLLDAASRLLCASMVTRPRRSDYANQRLAEAARDQLRAAAAGRHRGLPFAIDRADPARESPAESLSAGHFELAGLPRPVCQPRVETHLGIVYPDFWWPEQNLIGECDGAVKYNDANAYAMEKEREQALRDLGHGVVRWLAKEIMARPQVVVDRVSRDLGL